MSDSPKKNPAGDGNTRNGARQEDLEEIVVTAQKRQERLIDVPQSVTVLSGNELAKLGATQLRDFANSVPGLTLKTGGVGSNQISLRGVTTGTDSSPTVGVYVDEVPFGSSTPFAFAARFALDVGLFDVDRIEVLRGPQGTLYGASSMGGLIKYVTRRPDTNTFGVYAQTGVSATERGGVNYNIASAVNLPLVTDKAAVRVTGFESHDGGYIDNVTLDQKNVNHSDVYGGRIDLLLTPTDNLSIRLGGFAQNIARFGESTADYTFDGVPAYGDLNQHRGVPEKFDQRFRLASATVLYDLGPVTITSASSYQTVRVNWQYDLTDYFVPILNSPAVLGTNYTALGDIADLPTNKFTQELRIASKEGNTLEWLVGGFYTHETACDCEQFAPRDSLGAAPNDLLTSSINTRYSEYALFGDLTWHLNSKFDITGGAREAWNNQNFVQVGSGIFGSTSPAVRSSANVATYKADARYHLNDHATAYVRYATGYRPGGPRIVERDPVTGVASGPSQFYADRLKSYEAGMKAQTVDQRFGVDVAAYYIDWANIQTFTTVGGFGQFVNAPGGATIRGAELALTARPVSTLSLGSAVAVQHARMTEADAVLGAAAGERLPNVPRLTANVTADYVFMESGLRPTIGASVSYVGDRKASFDGSTQFLQYDLPAYTTIDLRSGITVNTITLQLFAHNLTDKRGEMSAQTQFAKPQVSIMQPRTVGISASVVF